MAQVNSASVLRIFSPFGPVKAISTVVSGPPAGRVAEPSVRPTTTRFSPTPSSLDTMRGSTRGPPAAADDAGADVAVDAEGGAEAAPLQPARRTMEAAEAAR